MKGNILVFGYFGYEGNQLDGQTIKTRNLYNLIKSKEQVLGEVTYFDTQRFQTSKLSLFRLLKDLLKANRIVYLPAQRNLRYIFPHIFLICKFFRKEILYIVVGGWLYEFLENKPFHRLLLRNINGIFPETKQLSDNLFKKYNFRNNNILPNFRINSYKPIISVNPKELKVVFMARISRMKGIDTVFEVAKRMEMLKGFSVKIFGPIDLNDSEYFITRVNQLGNVSYGGELEPKEIYTTLNQYDVMLLPTKYFTEGFPGSILDAYISGLPVIATRWKYADEFIDHQSCGYIVPFQNGCQDIINALRELYYDPALLLEMKYNAYKKSKEYSSEGAWKIIEPFLMA